MKLVIAVLSWFALVAALAGKAEGGDWREWFGKQRPEVAAQSPDDADTVPDAPGAKASAAPERSQPNLLQRFGSGTRRLFDRTSEAFTPKPKKKTAAKATSTKDRPFQGWMPNASRYGQKKPKAKSSGGIASWFRPSEPEGPSDTLEDFFSQPRP